ncbi:hypothetical protein [Streptomyces sp. AJS327]|uniref:hypothetical protein n=1 Tax=Streptomyces sp. AJS327 TaxID=2545265 RepID=UPI0015DD6593|nr:hypothetical protein [Streptomyces sp. AJS327]
MTVPTPSSSNPDPDSTGESGRPAPGSPGWGNRDDATGGSAGGRPDPYPAYPGGAGDPDPPEAGSDGIEAEAREGVVCGLAVALLALVLGPLWAWLAPRTPLITDGSAVYPKHPEGEEVVGADGSFLLISAGLGVLVGLVVFLVRRRGGVGLVIGMTVGALLAALGGWGIGVALGPETDLVEAARAAGAGATFDGPLKLQAKGVLLGFPFAALLVHMVLTVAFGKREPLPPPPPPAGPGAPGGGWADTGR